ncbi:hypothetical protein ACLMJK_002711 [Lecanora helva]
MSRPIDILVHISGPSLGKDDARYRKEAQGFLDFDPVERHDLCELNKDISIDEETSYGLDDTWGSSIIASDCERDNGALHEVKAREPKSVNEDSTDLERHAVIEDDKPGCGGESGEQKTRNEQTKRYESLPNKERAQDASKSSTRSSTSGRLSKLREEFLRTVRHNGTPTQQIKIASGSLSKPSRPSIPARTPLPRKSNDSPEIPLTGVKETPCILIARTPAPSRPQTAPAGQSKPPIEQSDSWKTPPSTIPDSQPNIQTDDGPLEISSSPYLKRPFLSSSPSPPKNSPPNTKRPRIQVHSSPPTETSAPAPAPAKTRSPPPPSSPSSPPPYRPPSSSPLPSIPSSSTFSTTSIYNSPSQLHPPPPPTSNQKFTTHLTPDLHRLTTHLPLSRGFHPFIQYQSRSLEALERGYWHIPLARWSHEVKNKFWEFLKTYIQGGRPGWGVRAFRERVAGEGTREGEEEEEVVKVYCWGEVVGYVWLMVFIASGKEIRGVGARWVDWREETVLQMV